MGDFGLLVVVAVIVVLGLALITLITRQYHRVPPSEVMVVYGRKEARMITNGGVFVMPILETYKKLNITIMTIKQEKDEVYTVSGVPIRLDWVSQVQIDPEESALRTAARAFLDKSRDEIRNILTETLSANFRAIVGQMTVEEIHRDRDAFVQKVQDLARDDVAAMGVRIISMGIEEISDDQGYLTAMAAPQIAAVKRDAQIAEAEATRAARVKAAAAAREAEQAELDAQREILAQREALQIREVEVEKKVGLARATSEQEVQKLLALAVEQKQEAEVLVPARAQRQAIEIQAEAERQRLTITAQANAEATRTRAQAEAAAIEQKGRADAAALQAMKEAEAAGQKAEAEALQARKLAEAEGEKAKLLAEAEGRRELAAASAAENEINLRQFLIEQIMQADVAKMEAIAQAMGGLGDNVRIVQIGSNGHNGSTGNTLMDMLVNIPEVAEIFRTKVEALSGEDLESTISRVGKLFAALKDAGDSPPPAPPARTSRSRKVEIVESPSAGGQD
ncbi:MAG TPA: SPFH domain-containing protein [Oceanobacillus sp.]|nr:SPFH domain-containing protein [Oceanobacillus sp.]